MLGAAWAILKGWALGGGQSDLPPAAAVPAPAPAIIVPTYPAQPTVRAFTYSSQAANTPLESVPGWSLLAGSAGLLQVASSGSLQQTAATAGAYGYETGSSAHFMETLLNTNTANLTQSFMCCVKMIDGGNFIGFRINPQLSTYEVYQCVSGTFTGLWQGAAISSVAGRWRLEASSNNTWTIYCNGVPQASGAIPTALQGATKVGCVTRTSYTPLNTDLVSGHNIGLGSVLHGPVHGGRVWFEGAPAVSYNGRTFVGTNRLTIPKPTGTLAGLAQITEVNESTGAVTTFTCASGAGWEDDHAFPVPVVRPDGRIIVFYCLHNDQTGIRYRISVAPGTLASGMSQEYVVPYGSTISTGVTYPNAYLLSGESNKCYLFYREDPRGVGMATSPDIATVGPATTNGGALAATPTWTTNVELVPLPPSSVQGVYIKTCSNGVDRIDFTLTNAQAAQAGVKIDVRHAYWKAGQLHGSDGTVLGASAVQFSSTTPIATSGAPDSFGDIWCWDIARNDSTGVVQVVFERFLSQTDHRAYYARWNGSAWSKQEIDAPNTSSQSISSAASPEQYYSPGLAIDPTRDGCLLISLGSGATTRVQDVWSYKAVDPTAANINWVKAKVSPPQVANDNFTRQNVRPFFVQSAVAGTSPYYCGWQRGEYDYFDSTLSYGYGYDCEIMLCAAT